MKKTLDCRLPGNCSISHIAALRQELMALLSQKGKSSVALHADEVHKVDTAGVQLLYALVMALQAKGVQWAWVDPSQKLKASAKLLGLSALLKLS